MGSIQFGVRNFTTVRTPKENIISRVILFWNQYVGWFKAYGDSIYCTLFLQEERAPKKVHQMLKKIDALSALRSLDFEVFISQPKLLNFLFFCDSLYALVLSAPPRSRGNGRDPGEGWGNKLPFAPFEITVDEGRGNTKKRSRHKS